MSGLEVVRSLQGFQVEPHFVYSSIYSPKPISKAIKRLSKAS